MAALDSLLFGDTEIVKMPWKPKTGDTFYSFGLSNSNKWGVCMDWWVEEPCCYALLEKGWVYSKKDEALAALPKVAAEMGVEYEM